ncbi:uncharacterized protein TNCV_926581 [Trichonephila clavipes]|nr:uncharacterized protein TNCV_926581 [Trichonephila clavipes]
MVPYTITPTVGAVCQCKVNAGLKSSPWGLHTGTRLSSLLKLNLDSSLKTTWFHSVAAPSRRERHHYKRRCRWVGVIGNPRYRHCESARRLAMVWEDTKAHSEGAACVWTKAIEAVGSTHAWRMM